MVKEKSIYWSHFTRTESNRASCNFCNKEMSCRSGITNLVKHLRSRHPEIELQPKVDHEESDSTTIIMTTQTNLDGQVIATIEPLTEAAKNDLEIDWENPIEISLESTELASVQQQLQSSNVKRRSVKKRSQCWSVFTKLEDNKVLCGYCGKKLSFSNGRVGNMKRHLRMKHDGLYRDLESKEIQKKKAMRPSSPQQFLEPQKPRFDRLAKRTRSFFPSSVESDVPQDMLSLMEETNEKLGFVPNAYQALSHRPDEMRSFLTYYSALMEDRVGGHLTKSDKEMIFIAVSAFNKCKYFTVAHSALFRMSFSNQTVADQLATNWETAQLEERERSILQFAMKILKCEAIKERHFEDLHYYGLDLEDAWDIGSIVSFCSLANRMAFLTNMLPNEQFYSLGWTEQLLYT